MTTEALIHLDTIKVLDRALDSVGHQIARMQRELTESYSRYKFLKEQKNKEQSEYLRTGGDITTIAQYI